MADLIEEKLLDEYMTSDYPSASNDQREHIRDTIGFRIHVLSHYHKQLGDAVKDRMQQAKESFIKIFLGS